MNRLLLGYSPDLDLFDDAPPPARLTFAHPHPTSVLVGEDTETATELLEAAACSRLPTMLARLLRSAAQASGGTLDRALEAELVTLLQRAARVALPKPVAFASHDGAARASRFFGIELEGLSPEDQEFESARRFIQLAQATAVHAAAGPQRVPPAVAARLATARAARQCAPGWSPALRATPLTPGRSRPHFVEGAHHA